jgi:hypothetical protein
MALRMSNFDTLPRPGIRVEFPVCGCSGEMNSRDLNFTSELRSKTSVFEAFFCLKSFII